MTTPGPQPHTAEMIQLLDLHPHPEGGHYRETYRDNATDAHGRPRSTAILFLLAAGEVSAWHRIDATEIWHHYAGAPLRLSLSPDGRSVTHHRLGSELGSGERPQLVVPPAVWQAAESLGDWTLVGCTVAPGFEFEHFELAMEGWQPGPAPP